jgi:hypothetical protein
MKIKFSRLAGLGLFLCVSLGVGLVGNTKVAFAAGSDRFDPNPNDVAIFGTNSKIQAPRSHFRIETSGTNADVTLENACVKSTAAQQGLSATLDGVTKSYPGACGAGAGCKSTDICFFNVPNGSVLVVNRINGQGHQPFNVRADARTAGGDVKVTQLGNPNRASSSYGSDGDNYGVNVWGGGTFNMDVPCSATPVNGTKVYFKWKDADVGQYNQGGSIQIKWAITNSDFGNVQAVRPINLTSIQENNKEYTWHLPSWVDVLPGDHIQWIWENVDGGNDIQHVLPYSEILNQPTCTPPDVGANCQATASSDTPIVGTNVNVQLIVRNTGRSTWPSSVTVTGSSAHNPGALSPNQTQQFNDTFTSGAPGPAEYFYDVVYNGDVIASCSDIVYWQPQITASANCTTLHINNPLGLSFRLEFFDTTTGTVAIPRAAVPITNGQITYDYPIFQSWYPGIVPHHSYVVQVYDSSGAVFIAQTNEFGRTPRCISPTCTAINAPVVEPGETVQIQYGMQIFDSTDRDFSGYGVTVSPLPGSGLVAVGNTTDGGNLIHGISVNKTGPFTFIANYRGGSPNLQASLSYGGGSIDPLFAGLPCQTTYTPQTRTALKVTQGDVSAGGGFRYLQPSGAQQCTLTPNRYIAPITAGGDPSVGGIRAFASTAPYVSSSQFAAYALGLIHSPGGADNAQRYGFFSDSTNKFVNKLTFANVGMTGGNLGGSLGGEFVDAHCAPDFYHETSDNLTPTFITAGGGVLNPDDLPLAADGTGQFYYQNPGNFVRIGGTLSNDPTKYPRKRVTIYVNGDVLITNNAGTPGIAYGPWSFDLAGKTNNSPYLTIIAKGNIYVNFTVARMDGVYIAQPLDDAGITKGSFYTCSVNGSISRAQIRSNCMNTLTVNGSVIAQHVNLLRSQGTLADGTGAAAENFNFIPSTVLGLPGFRHDSGAVITNSLDSLYSLPPVF